jgi:hypothetical protein
VSSIALRGDRRALGALGVTAGVLLALAGCSSSTSSATAPAPSATAPAPSATAPAPSATAPAPSATAATAPATAATAPAAAGTSPGALPTASMTPLPAASGQLTGTQLESVLLPATDFPAGFVAPSSGAISSGGSLTSGPATYNLATMSCASFIQHLGAIGFGETAMVSGSVAATGQAYDQLVYQFGAAPAASAFLSGVQALAGRCVSFTATANGSKGTFSLRATPGPAVGGHPAVELLQTGTLGTSKLVLDTLLCASGVDVFAAAGVGVGGAAPAQPAKDAVVYNLMKRQAAAVVLG